ncbi:myosin heavy chain 95F isoform X2 [Ischnura elegans]|uniref:myosin heavy chain 95F isoform X2 n=1 Tax=Ischnura elegans TaxID=197161 RepID=UPI001ED8A9B7|nr:myosin heavy chain 95F isoform X2 [Ischnura elegans]
MENSKVWVSDPADGFILGRIIDLNGNDDVTVNPIDRRRQPIVCALDRVYPAGDDIEKDVDDNCSLMNLNEATLLNNLRLRYAKDKIYTYVANILIAVNPYKDIPDLYSSKTLKSYQGKSLGVMPPHVFAIADKAFRDMKVLKKSQSIIVSGESGAGKTESTKYILRYLCDLWGSAAGPIEQKILDANPVLEAFGNAKTTRNNNSSRFGKFIEVHFDSKCQVVGGFISHYLLEKSRICTQGPEERDYHVFYHICAGAPESLRQQLHITKPDDFHYLRRGCTQYFTMAQSENKLNNSQKSRAQVEKGSLHDPLLDDVKDFKNLDDALSRIGLSEKDRLSIYTMVAGVLHLGNVAFEDNPEDLKGGSRVCMSAEKSLSIAANLMGVDVEELRQALVSKVMQTSRGGLKGTVIMVPLKVYEANHARDALAKAVFNKLFDYIVQRINQSIPFKASSYYIGVLDIAGFEYFTVNSYEQFCINYCNEKLQQFFNERILKDEQTLYEKEGLVVRKIEFVDNQDCIDLIESKGLGIFSLLDEESKLPKHSAAHFTMEVHSRFSGHFRLAYPRMSKLRDHREIRDDEGFLFRHFAGAVCYQTSQFIEKNNDALHASLEGLVQESRNPFLKALFASLNTQQKGKLNFISVGSKFKTQLGELMDKLKSTGTNFVRCIKPNLKMEHHHFDGGSILSQLQCSGMTKVLELMQSGYPSRAQFRELYELYRHSMPPRLVQLDPRMFCKALFHALGLNEKDFCFGVEKVFFRAGKFAEFDQIMKSDPENLQEMLAKVMKWLLSARWKKVQWGALSVIKLKNKIKYRRECYIIIQKNMRMLLAKKKHQPRYRGIMKINSLKSMLTKMEGIIKQLKKDKESSAADVKALQGDMARAIQQIRNNERMSREEINQLHTQLMNKANKQLGELQKKVEHQRIAEEQERMRKLKEQMEAEERRKEEEERKKREDEEIKKMKIEMEARRKAEEELRKKQEEEDRKTAALLEAQLQKEAAEEATFREQQEQERRDYELSYRLSQETNTQLDDMTLPLRRLAVVESKNFPSKLNRADKTAMQGNKKYDMSKYKYSELRDIINTSCEIELLEACRIEFHRRLKVYHAWKAKNRRRTTMEEKERAPRSIMEAANVQRTPVKDPVAVSTDRYFRIPFIRPAPKSSEGGNEAPLANVNSSTRGWWYAHFHGQYVARQMELHPNKPAILLVAGIDDMQMCELSLDETGLTRKRGAEILEHEFNQHWEAHSGKPFVSRDSRIK